ncbi:unnamed protein product [Amoebophrya sp. A120]|nr:unnamed protein product [Amoebophrya sp. A120]|eukprot:GSA120T00002017001.1
MAEAECIYKSHLVEGGMSQHTRQIRFDQVVLLKKIVILNRNDSVLDRGIEFVGQTHPLVKPNRLQIWVKEDTPPEQTQNARVGGSPKQKKNPASHGSLFTALEGKQSAAPAPTGYRGKGGKGDVGIVYTCPGRKVEVDSLVLQGEFTKLSLMIFAVPLNRKSMSYEDRKPKLQYKCLRQPLPPEGLDVEPSSGNSQFFAGAEWALPDAALFRPVEAVSGPDPAKVKHTEATVSSCLQRLLETGLAGVLPVCNFLLKGEKSKDFLPADVTTALASGALESIPDAGFCFLERKPDLQRACAKILWTQILRNRADQAIVLEFMANVLAKDPRFAENLCKDSLFLPVMSNAHRSTITRCSQGAGHLRGRKRRRIMRAANNAGAGLVVPAHNNSAYVTDLGRAGSCSSGADSDGGTQHQIAKAAARLAFTHVEFRNHGNFKKKVLLERLLQNKNVVAVFARWHDDRAKSVPTLLPASDHDEEFLWGYYPRSQFESRVKVWKALHQLEVALAEVDESGTTRTDTTTTQQESAQLSARTKARAAALKNLLDVLAHVTSFFKQAREGSTEVVSSSWSTSSGQKTAVERRSVPDAVQFLLREFAFPSLLQRAYFVNPVATARVIYLLLTCRGGATALALHEQSSSLRGALSTPELKTADQLQRLLETSVDELPLFAEVFLPKDSEEEEHGSVAATWSVQSQRLVRSLPLLVAAHGFAELVMQKFVEEANSNRNVLHSKKLAQLAKLLHDAAAFPLGRFVVFRAAMLGGSSSHTSRPAPGQQLSYSSNPNASPFQVLLDCLEESVEAVQKAPERTFFPLPRFLTALLHRFLVSSAPAAAEDDEVLILQCAQRYGRNILQIASLLQQNITHHPRLDVESAEQEQTEKLRVMVQGGRREMDSFFDQQVAELQTQLHVFRRDTEYPRAESVLSHVEQFGGVAPGEAAAQAQSATTLNDNSTTPLYDWDFKRLTSTDTHHYFKKCLKQLGFAAHRCKSVDIVEVQYPDSAAAVAADAKGSGGTSAAAGTATGAPGAGTAAPGGPSAAKLEQLPSASLLSEVPLLAWWYLAHRTGQNPKFCIDLFLADAVQQASVADDKRELHWAGDESVRHNINPSRNEREALSDRFRNTHNQPQEIFNKFQRVVHCTLVKCAGGLGLNLEAAALQTEDLLFAEECYEIQERYLLLAEAVCRTLAHVLAAVSFLPKYQSEDLWKSLFLLTSRLCGGNFFQVHGVRRSPLYRAASRAVGALTQVFHAWARNFVRLSAVGVHNLLPRTIEFATSLPQNYTAGLLVFVTLGACEKELFGTTKLRYLELDLVLDGPANTPHLAAAACRPVADRLRTVWKMENVSQLRETEPFVEDAEIVKRGKNDKKLVNQDLVKHLSTPTGLSFRTDIDPVLNRVPHVFCSPAPFANGSRSSFNTAANGGFVQAGSRGGRSTTRDHLTTTRQVDLNGDALFPHVSISQPAQERSLLNCVTQLPGTDRVEIPIGLTDENEQSRRRHTRTVLEEDNRFTELNVLDLCEMSYHTVCLSLSSTPLLHVLAAHALVKLHRDCHVKWLRAALKLTTDLLTEAENRIGELQADKPKTAHDKNVIHASFKRPLQAVGRQLLVLARCVELSVEGVLQQEAGQILEAVGVRLLHLCNKHEAQGLEPLVDIVFRILLPLVMGGTYRTSLSMGQLEEEKMKMNTGGVSTAFQGSVDSKPTTLALSDETAQNIAMMNQLLSGNRNSTEGGAKPPSKDSIASVPSVDGALSGSGNRVDMRTRKRFFYIDPQVPSLPSVAVRSLSKSICTQVFEQAKSSHELVENGMALLLRLYASERYLFPILYQPDELGTTKLLFSQEELSPTKKKNKTTYLLNPAFKLDSFLTKFASEVAAVSSETEEGFASVTRTVRDLAELCARTARDARAFGFETSRVLGAAAPAALHALLSPEANSAWVDAGYQQLANNSEDTTSTSTQHDAVPRSWFTTEAPKLLEFITASFPAAAGAPTSTSTPLLLSETNPDAAFVAENYHRGGSLTTPPPARIFDISVTSPDRQHALQAQHAKTGGRQLCQQILASVEKLELSEEWQRFAILEKSLAGESEWLFDSSVDRHKQTMLEQNLAVRKKQRMNEALESQQAEDYWTSDAHYGQYYRRDKTAKAKQLALGNQHNSEMKALVDAQFIASFMANQQQQQQAPPPPPANPAAAAAAAPPSATAAPAAPEAVVPPTTAPAPAAPAPVRTLAEEFQAIAAKGPTEKRAVKDPNRLKTDPRMKSVIAQYLDEFPLVKKFLEED